MRIILLIAVLLPSLAQASEWVKLGETPEARIMFDKKGTETLRQGTTAWLKFIYRKEQPGQTITKSRPFDSSINQYYLICSTRKYQVLQLYMFNKNEKVGSFLQRLNLNDLDDAKVGRGITLLMDRVCPADKPASSAKKN